MRVIITGGTGLIGRALSAHLSAAGRDVVLLSRRPEAVTGLAGEVRAEKWDGRTADGWAHLADGAGAIVNLAGANISGDGLLPSRWNAARKRLIRESRLDAGRAVVEATERASQKPGVVIQASGVGFYGPHADDPVTEDSSPGQDFLAAFAAREWEPSTAPVEALGVRRAVIRTGVVLSKTGGALRPMLLQHRFYAGGPIGNGRQWLSWIQLEDEARAILFLIDNPAASGAYNLAAPRAVTNAELSRALGRVLHRPSWLPLPGAVMRAAFGEVADLLLTGQQAVPKRLLEQGFQFRFPEIEPALREAVA
ncbi:MAG TPA: TIGR01777 family oxidoreductase [Anaerolineae bacterium]|nr:TIGR01777 family oxidoreductase [Anaerolineae bacterium]